MILGHVGDTRCLRVRNGQIEQLSTDHAVTEPESFLTRCIGAGQRSVDVDVSSFEICEQDRYVLATDGLWGLVSDTEIQRMVSTMSAQAAAEELVRQANRRGGYDNSTVVVLAVRSLRGFGDFAEVDLPTEELRQPALLRQPDRGLLAPRWPWVALSVGLSILLVAVLRLWFDADPFGDLLDWFG